jgi:hypothetical protein
VLCACARACARDPDAALGIVDHLRRSFARFKLCAHFLYLRCLLFELGGESLHSLLLLGDGGFQGLHFLVLLEELVEQHVVDLLVVDGCDFTILAVHHELGIHLGDLLRDQTILRRGFPVAVEFEGYWLEPVQRFTGLVHRLNVVFEAPGRFAGHAEARVVAQLVWSFLLGVVFACLRIAGTSIWPVAVLHGAMNAFVHVNRLGVEIQPSLIGAAALAFAPLPLCIYGVILLDKQRRITVT